MRIKEICKEIKKSGYVCDVEIYPFGPVVRVDVPGSNRTVCGIVPIGEKDYMKFANFLINKTDVEYQKEYGF